MIEQLWRYAAIVGVSFAVSYAVTPYAIRLGQSKGWVRPDAHKPGKPLIPNTGGIPLFIAQTVGVVVAALLFPHQVFHCAVYWVTIASAFVIGFIDDIVILKGQVKALLTVFPVFPFIISVYMYPHAIPMGHPRVPILGTLRLTIVYWLLIPLAIAGPANAVNMLDIMNGVMVSTTLLAALSMVAASAIFCSEAGIALGLVLVGSLLGYYRYNRYPARIFNGDSGSLQVGAAIGALALLSREEFIAMVAILPHIVNAAMVVASMGFREHREVGARPISVENRVLVANSSPSAPLSLTRLLLALGGPAREPEVCRAYTLIEAIAAAMAVISAYMAVRV